MSTARRRCPSAEDRCPFDLCDGSGFVVDDATNTASDCRCRAQRVSRARARRSAASSRASTAASRSTARR